MSTEVELEEGQTFAIGGLLDNRDTETFNKIPGLATFRSLETYSVRARSPRTIRSPGDGNARNRAADSKGTSSRSRAPGVLFASEYFLEPAPATRYGCDGTGAVNQGGPASMPVEDSQGHADHVGGRTGLRDAAAVQFVPAVLAPQPGQAPPQTNSAPPPSAAPSTPAPATPTTSAPPSR
jgi:hypothetical protein